MLSPNQLTAKPLTLPPGSLLPLRLAHISIHCPPLARQALSLAIAAAKKGKNVPLYSRLHDIASRLGFSDLATTDADWVARQDEANKRELVRLEGELRGYKNNMIRESTRMGQEDLAVHHLLTGGPPLDNFSPQSINNSGLNAAYQAFAKMRDYCTTPAHVASMTLRLTYTALLQAVSAQQVGSSPTMLYNSAMQNAQRIRTVGVKDEEMKKLLPIMHATVGIANLGEGNYRDAAISFLATPPDYPTHGSVYNTDFTRAVASGNDIAIYGGLCALATMTRDELVDNVLGGSFRAFLELEPHMRKAISLYTTAKYQACLATLNHYHADWSLDIFLGAGAAASHVDRLFARIREKSITAYFSSFSQVSLASLATTFPPVSASASSRTPHQAMENEILSMIENGKLNARLDVVNGLLIAPQKEARSATHADAKSAAEEVERTLLLRLHKVNMFVAGLEVPRPKGAGGWAGAGGFSMGNGGYV
jgi:COP9 signalosome complex subunit 1